MEALFEAGVQEAPARLMLHWLERSVYRIKVESHVADIPSSRGVKQGCPASPLLYAAFMSLITRRLDCKLGRNWVADHLTAFADDLHVSCLIRSYVDLDRFCQCLGVVLHTLSQHGMVVNVQKVAVILALSGTSRRQALRAFTKRSRIIDTLESPAQGRDCCFRSTGRRHTWERSPAT